VRLLADGGDQPAEMRPAAMITFIVARGSLHQSGIVQVCETPWRRPRPIVPPPRAWEQRGVCVLTWPATPPVAGLFSRLRDPHR
jgi:hypothetical protein